jgi:hypothetical protein
MKPGQLASLSSAGRKADSVYCCGQDDRLSRQLVDLQVSGFDEMKDLPR